MDQNPLLEESHSNNLGESHKTNNRAEGSEGAGRHAPQNSEYEISHFQPAIFDAPQS